MNSPTAPNSRFVLNGGSIAHERVDGEVIAIHMTEGHYFSMSGPAADVWSLLVDGYSAQEISTFLSGVFERVVEITDFEPFVSQLVAFQLIVPSQAQDAAVGAELPNDYERRLWSQPLVEKFEDLEDLILLDPIHDTNRLGWPYVGEADVRS